MQNRSLNKRNTLLLIRGPATYQGFGIPPFVFTTPEIKQKTEKQIKKTKTQHVLRIFHTLVTVPTIYFNGWYTTSAFQEDTAIPLNLKAVYLIEITYSSSVRQECCFTT